MSENKGMLKKEEIRRKNLQHERTLKPPSSTIHGGEGEGKGMGRKYLRYFQVVYLLKHLALAHLCSNSAFKTSPIFRLPPPAL